jgi:hypothetical protein
LTIEVVKKKGRGNSKKVKQPGLDGQGFNVRINKAN